MSFTLQAVIQTGTKSSFLVDANEFSDQARELNWKLTARMVKSDVIELCVTCTSFPYLPSFFCKADFDFGDGNKEHAIFDNSRERMIIHMLTSNPAEDFGRTVTATVDVKLFERQTRKENPAQSSELPTTSESKKVVKSGPLSEIHHAENDDTIFDSLTFIADVKPMAKLDTVDQFERLLDLPGDKEPSTSDYKLIADNKRIKKEKLENEILKMVMAQCGGWKSSEGLHSGSDHSGSDKHHSGSESSEFEVLETEPVQVEGTMEANTRRQKITELFKQLTLDAKKNLLDSDMAPAHGMSESTDGSESGSFELLDDSNDMGSSCVDNTFPSVKAMLLEKRGKRNIKANPGRINKKTVEDIRENDMAPPPKIGRWELELRGTEEERNGRIAKIARENKMLKQKLMENSFANEDYQMELKKTRLELKKSEEEVAKLKNEAEATTEKHKKDWRAVDQLYDLCGHLEVELNKSREEAGNLRKSSEAAQEENQKLKGTLKAQKSTEQDEMIMKLEQQAIDMMKKLESSQQEVKKLEGELVESKQKNEKLSDEVLYLKYDATQVDDELNFVKSQLEISRKEDRKDQSSKDLEQQLEQTKKKLLKEQTNSKHLFAQCAALGKLTQKLEGQIKDMESDMDAIIKMDARELKNAEQKILELRAQIETFEAQKVELTKNVTKACDNIEKKVYDLNHHCGDLTWRFHQLMGPQPGPHTLKSHVPAPVANDEQQLRQQMELLKLKLKTMEDEVSKKAQDVKFFQIIQTHLHGENEKLREQAAKLEQYLVVENFQPKLPEVIVHPLETEQDIQLEILRLEAKIEGFNKNRSHLLGIEGTAVEYLRNLCKSSYDTNQYFENRVKQLQDHAKLVFRSRNGPNGPKFP